MSRVLTANHAGVVALAACQLPEHAACPATIAPLAIIQWSMALLALHASDPFSNNTIDRSSNNCRVANTLTI